MRHLGPLQHRAEADVDDAGVRLVHPLLQVGRQLGGGAALGRAGVGIVMQGWVLSCGHLHHAAVHEAGGHGPGAAHHQGVALGQHTGSLALQLLYGQPRYSVDISIDSLDPV